MSLLRENAVLALFTCLALGYLIGKLRVGPITLGGICGTLIVSMLIGSRHVSVNPDVKNIAFGLFIFSLGYIAGPQFFANLNAKGLRFGVLCLVEVVCVLGLAYGIAKSFNLDVGTASGILAGSATESAVVGTAQGAIGSMHGLTPNQVTAAQAHVATAYSVCYLFGLITIVMLTSQIFPRMLRFNLAEASRELWERGRGASRGLGSDETPALPQLVGRTYVITGGAGDSIGQIEAASRERVSIEGVRRGAKVLKAEPDTVLRHGDQVLVVGMRDAVLEAGDQLGTETSAVPGLDSPLATKQIVVTNKAVRGQSIQALRDAHPELAEGVYVTDLQRVDQHLPVTGDTTLHNGDTVTVIGARGRLDKFAGKVGATVRQDSVDYIYISVGICLGVLLGMVAVHAGNATLELGTGGGCLIAGLIFGWARAQHPTFGAYPPVAAQTAKDIGLSIFIAVTGLSAGPDAASLLKKYPALLPISGVLMVLVPAVISLVIGRKVLKIEPPILMGAIAGQQCSTPAITAVTNTAASSVPMLGYTITYTLSNFLLPLTGPVLVALVGAKA
jgi:putative transport protein